MNSDKFTLITPCLNEEKFIGKLLYTLSLQSDQNFQFIIIDGGSTDKTIEVIEGFRKKLPDLQLIKADKKGVSYQRNLGAKAALTDYLLFLDADSRLDLQYVEDFKDEVKRVSADVATAYIWPDSRNPMDWFFWLGGNIVTDLSRYVWPLGYGMNLYIRKSLFDSINGFNEELRIAEDVDLVKRAIAAGGKYAVLKKPKYYTDVRRLRSEGHAQFMVKTMLIAWQAYKHGSFSKIDVEYKMGEWSETDKEKELERKSLFEKVKDSMLFWRD
jgi:glycosyltransferase involved in cell wall biosynthesis